MAIVDAVHAVVLDRARDARPFDDVAGAIAIGDLDRAARQLEEISGASPQTPRRARLVALLRAEIAFARGDHRAVADHCEEAIRGAEPLTTKLAPAADGVLRAEALALHALSSAVASEEGASRRAESALASPWASGRATSRALLAQAMVIADSSSLASHLEAHRRAILANTTLRERALLHSLEERQGIRARLGYRAPGRSATNADRLALWEATRHRRAPIAPRSPAAARDDLRRARARAAQSTRAHRRRRILFLVAVLGSTAALAACSSAGRLSYVEAALAILATSLPLLFYLSVRASTIHELALLRAERLAGRGEIAESRATAKNVDDRGDRGHRTRARKILARLDERDGDFTMALRHIDAAIAEFERDGVRDPALAELVARRVRLLALLGRPAEADAELEILQANASSSPRPETPLGVRLVLALVTRDLDRIAALAHERTPGMSLDPADDALFDLALAATGSLEASSLQRLRAVLERDALLREELDALAPGFRASVLEDAAPKVRIEESEEEDVASSESSAPQRRESHRAT